MAIHTSEINSASENGNISINPNGSGKTILQKNTGNGEDIIAVDNTGAIKSFDASNLAILPSNPSNGDVIVVQRGDAKYQVDATNFGTGGGGSTGGGTGGGPTGGGSFVPGLVNWAPTSTPTSSPEGVDYSGLDLYGQVQVTWDEASTLLSTEGSLRVKVGGSGSWGQGPSAVGVGDQVYLKWDENAIGGAPEGEEITGAFISASGAREEKFITLKRTPSQMSFGKLTDVAINASGVASAAVIGDYNVPTTISLQESSTTMTNVEISVAGGTFEPLDSTGIFVTPGLSVQLRGDVGSDVSTSYAITVNIGVGTYDFTVTTAGSAPSVTQPSIVSPFNGAVNVGSYQGGVTLASSAYQTAGSVGLHNETDWEVYTSAFPLQSTNTITSATSQNTTWALQQTGITAPSSALGVAYDPDDGLFMVIEAVKSGQSIVGFKAFTTTDLGQTWTEGGTFVDSHPNPAYLFNVEFSGVGYNKNGTWLVLGKYINTSNTAPYAFACRSTNNGSSWSQTNYTDPSSLVVNIQGSGRELLWWNGQWRIPTNQGIASSGDGVNWAAGTAPTTGTIVSISPGDNGIIGFGNAGYHQFSANGTTFTEFYDDQISGCATYGNGLWVAARRTNGNVSYVKTSEDGLSWTQRKTYTQAEINLTDQTAAYGNGQFILLGTDSTGGSSRYVTSFDGINWSSPVNTNVPNGRFSLLEHTLGYENSKRDTTSLSKFYAIAGNGSQTIFCSTSGASTVLSIRDALSDGFLVGDTITDNAGADEGIISFLDNSTVHLIGSLNGYDNGDNIYRSASSYQKVDETTTTAPASLTSRVLAPAPGRVVTPTLVSSNSITAVGDSANNWSTKSIGGSALNPSRGSIRASNDPNESDTLYIWQAGQGSTIFKKSTDGGTSWSDLGTLNYELGGDDRWDVNKNVIIAVGYDGTNNALFRSTDGGSSWSNIAYSKFNIPAGEVVPSAPRSVSYVGDNTWMVGVANWRNGLGAVSTDNGETWRGIIAPVTTSGPFGSVAVKTDSNYVMLGRPSSTSPTSFYGSQPDNLPNTARLSINQTGTNHPRQMAYSPVNGGTIIAVSDLDVWRSRTRGAGWQNIDDLFPASLGLVGGQRHISAIGDTFFLSTGDPADYYGFWYSQDGGSTWGAESAADQVMGRIVRTIDGTYASFAGTDNGGVAHFQTATIPFTGVGLTISGCLSDGFQPGDIIDDSVGGARAEILAVNDSSIALASGTTGFEVGEKIRRGGVLLSNSNYFARVRYRSDDGVVSNFSEFSRFTTGNLDG